MEFDILDNKFIEDLLVKRPYSAIFGDVGITFLKKPGQRVTLSHNGNLGTKLQKFLVDWTTQLNELAYKDNSNNVDMCEVKKVYDLMMQNNYEFHGITSKVLSLSKQYKSLREHSFLIKNDEIKFNDTASSVVTLPNTSQSFEDFLLNSKYLKRTK